MKKRLLWWHLMHMTLFAFALSGCAAPSVASTPTGEPIIPPDQDIPSAAFTLEEEPLQGQLAGIPNVFIVPSQQFKSDMAAYLKTTVRQLNRVNPGLPDPIEPGTLIVIPSDYHTDGEPLITIAVQTGMPEDVLLAANPGLTLEAELPAGTILAVPPLYIVPEDTLLIGAADRIGTDSGTLLAANPELIDTEGILKGSVLVIPPESE